MSEYQYYEFRAIDQPLSKKDQEYLRELSTRAEISSSSFINEYQWGDFKGDPLKLMHRCFDLHVYFANWGTHQLLLKVPKSALDGIDLKTYSGYCLNFHPGADHFVVSFNNPENDTGSDSEFHEQSWADDLLPIRELLLAGDLRPFYLAWLAGIDGESNKPGPPVPDGLNELPEAIEALADYLEVDSDLFAAAATLSKAASAVETNEDRNLTDWIAGLESSAKDAYLLQLFQGDAVPARADLRRQYQALIRQKKSTEAGAVAAPDSGPSGKTLWTTANELEATRRHAEAETKRLAKEKAEREKAEARRKRLSDLADRFAEGWKEVEAHIQLGNAHYPQAVSLLVDLRDAAAANGKTVEFTERFVMLTEASRRRYSLMDRLRKVGLM